MTQNEQLTREEERSLQQAVTEVLELPMFLLAMVMLAIFIVELTVQLSPDIRRTLAFIASAIWWLFVAEYAFRVFTAEDRLDYLKTHWLDALFVLVPFLRVFAIFRVVRATRLLRTIRPPLLLKTFVTTRRGLRQLGGVLGRRSFPYVVATTIVVFFVGSLIIYLLERGVQGANITTFGNAMWWSIGVITTVGNELYPVSAEGRIIASLIMIYGVGIFGYIAATLASYFVSAEPSQKPVLSEQERAQLADLSAKLDQLIDKHKREE
ncbi:MAG: ion transporter [Armatimonadota bacterium]